MRGALWHGAWICSDARIIPADAGSTYIATLGRHFGEDHPRGCGEHGKVVNVPVRAPGSSPRMRGARPCRSRMKVRMRIIPADAGSTTSVCAGRSRSKGSSPRMRGALAYSAAANLSPRIIPADAGSTSSTALYKTLSGDHPRGCGEHCIMPSVIGSLKGSSPRMRGAQFCVSGLMNL